jgi:hypothetical protein
MVEEYLKLGHHHLLPHPFLSTTHHQLSHHSRCIVYAIIVEHRTEDENKNTIILLRVSWEASLLGGSLLGNTFINM